MGITESLNPGSAGTPRHERDLRRYEDLNDITFARFKSTAIDTGRQVEWFKFFPTLSEIILRRLPILRNTRLPDVLLPGAAACLRKPAGAGGTP
jgi:hypothetical protein